MKHRIDSLIQITAFGVLSIGLIGSAQAGLACHVSESGVANGSSWTQTMSLTSALADPICSEIWVKQGIYYPTLDNDRNVSFVIDRAVRLLGGFMGTESSPGQRVPGEYPSILSGNIGDINDETDNSYHVVFVDGTVAGITSSTEINGFTISQGYGSTDSGQISKGGGLYCDGEGAGNECSPLLVNLTFIDNFSRSGGALYNSAYGGGISHPDIRNTSFILNSASLFGGAVYNDGFSGSTSPTYENVTFYGNQALVGGAVFIKSWTDNSSPYFNHATFYFNTATTNGGAIGGSAGENDPSLLLVTNSIFWGNGAGNSGPNAHILNLDTLFEHSVLETGCPANSSCSDITTSDPILSPLGDHGGFSETLLPGANGSAIDTALAEDCTNTDQRGVVRPQGLGCDMGAVELTQLESDLIFINGFEEDM